MSTSVQFTPSSVSVFTFQPVLAGITYNATVTWNTAGQRYYLNLYDLSGNLILCRAVCSSGPRLQAQLTWANGVAQVVVMANHNVPVGQVANIRISQSDTAYDGNWQALATAAQVMTYPMPNPELSTSPSGLLDFPLNLVGGYGIGWLLWHYDLQQFEYESS
jgi:hypothetical protein